MTRTLTRIAAATVVLMGVTALAAAQAQPDAALAKAIDQVQNGYLDDAVAALDTVVRRLSPLADRKDDLAQAYLWLGIAYAQQDAEKSARASFREALRLEPRVSLAEGWPPKVARLFAAVRAEVGTAVASPRASEGRAPAQSDAEAFQEYAQQIEAAAQRADQSFFDGMFDKGATLDLAMKGLDGPPGLAAEFRSIETSNWSFAKGFLEQLRQGAATYRFLRIHAGAGGRPQAVFRLMAKDGGATYHEYALRRDASGVKAVDFYIYAGGEWKSDSLKRNWLAALRETGAATQLSRLAGVENEMVKHGPEIVRIGQLHAAGQSAEALAALRLLRAYEPYAPPGSMATLVAGEDFVEFVRSDEHKRWAAERR